MCLFCFLSIKKQINVQWLYYPLFAFIRDPKISKGAVPVVCRDPKISKGAVPVVCEGAVPVVCGFG